MVQQLVARQCLPAVVRAAQVIRDAFLAGHKLLLCGNGGSAADCQHVAAEVVSRLRSDLDRPGLPAVVLTTDTSFLTAFANDCGYDGVFARPLHYELSLVLPSWNLKRQLQTGPLLSRTPHDPTSGAH